MKNLYYLIFLQIFGTLVNAQDIKSLEHELSISQSGEEYGNKIKLARLLHAKDPFNISAIDYICRYYKEKNIDSVNTFFKKLIASHPGKAEPYLLHAEFLNYDKSSDYLQEELHILEKALDVDGENNEANYEIAKYYYKDFIWPTRKREPIESDITDEDWVKEGIDSYNNAKRESTHPDSAEKSLFYFQRPWDLDITKRKLIYHVIKQLECHLKIDSKEKYSINDNISYFPHGHFANLKAGWQCDMTRDYLFDIEMANNSAEFKQLHLIDLNEPSLNRLDNVRTIYRFTWLRSFHNPIVVRIEKSLEDEINLYWKIGKGLGGYEPEGIKEKGNLRISPQDWRKFQELLRNANYDALQNEEDILMTDGATWTLERKAAGKYDAKTTNSPGKDFQAACLFLIKLADIKIKNKEIY